MTAPGFIISLDNSLDDGTRSNWCQTKQWWTNQSIQLTGTVDNSTAKVGDKVTIQAEVRGTTLGLDGLTVECIVNSIQAWVCYPNTIAGAASQNLIVWSMNPANPARSLPPSLPRPVVCFTGAPDDPSPVTTGFQPLAPVWVPGDQDLIPPNTYTHMCVVATCAGFADVNGADFSVGTQIFSDDLSKFNICNDPHQGQRNINLFPISKGQITPINFGFLAGIVRAGREPPFGPFTVQLAPVPQQEIIDPIIRNVLESSAFKDLDFRPSNIPLKSISLAKNPHKCSGWLEKIICEPEEIIHNVAEGIEHFIHGLGHKGGDGHHHGGHGKGTCLHIKLPKGGEVVSLILQAEIQEEEEVGNVHVFDVVQTLAEGGERGGYRFAIVVVP